MANSLIHWPTGAWLRDSVGEAGVGGRANGREVDGGVVYWRRVGGVWLTLKGGGQQPLERGGALGLGNLKVRAGLAWQGRDVVPCAERRQDLRGLLPKSLRGAGGLWKGESGGCAV